MRCSCGLTGREVLYSVPVLHTDAWTMFWSQADTVLVVLLITCSSVEMNNTAKEQCNGVLHATSKYRYGGTVQARLADVSVVGVCQVIQHDVILHDQKRCAEFGLLFFSSGIFRTSVTGTVRSLHTKSSLLSDTPYLIGHADPTRHAPLNGDAFEC
jgi:hypothetical protein